MEKQHITYFKIENFKRFDSFEMNNLGQFNLIVGDNNVGKTSVLEALTFDEDLPQLMFNFYSTLVFRSLFTHVNNNIIDPNEVKTTQFWEMIFRNIDEKISIDIVRATKEHYELEFISTENLSLNILDEVSKITNKNNLNENFFNNQIDPLIELHNFNIGKTNVIGAYFNTIPSGYRYNIVPFIAANFSYGIDLVSTFYDSFNANKKLRRELEFNLKQFIPFLEEVIVHKFSSFQEGIGIILTNQNEAVPIQRFGEGTIRYCRILMETIIAKNKRLMIDEIGTGIHFTRLTSFWKSIIKLCHTYQVQLFATTHSLECQQAFVEALESPDMQHFQQDARNISLIENKKGGVEAVTYNFEQFGYALNIGFNTRGGSL